MLLYSSDGPREDSPRTADAPSRHGNTKVKVTICTACQARRVDTQQQSHRQGTPMLTVCREMLTQLVDRQKGEAC